MKKYIYQGDFGTNEIANKEYVLISGAEYELSESEKKVRQLVAQKKLIEVVPLAKKKIRS